MSTAKARMQLSLLTSIEICQSSSMATTGEIYSSDLKLLRMILKYAAMFTAPKSCLGRYNTAIVHFSTRV